MHENIVQSIFLSTKIQVAITDELIVNNWSPSFSKTHHFNRCYNEKLSNKIIYQLNNHQCKVTNGTISPSCKC